MQTPTDTRVRYPWRLWTDGRARTAKLGEDFWCTPASFTTRCYQAACNRGLKAYTHIDTDDDTVYFRFYRNA